MVVLDDNKKTELCITLAQHLSVIRRLLGLTQKQFGQRCGISSTRLSVIENGHEIMSWVQFSSIMFICFFNKRVKDYIFSNDVFDITLYQYFQMKNEITLPQINNTVDEMILTSYINKYNKQKIEDEIYILNERLKIFDETNGEVVFEYLPIIDTLKYSYRNADNKLIRCEIVKYIRNKVYKETVHADFVETFLHHMFSALRSPKYGNFEYKTKISRLDYEWHKLYYHSTADENGIVKSFVGRVENINKIVLERNNAIRRASIDRLTNIYNKTSFKEQVVEVLKSGAIESCAMLMIDLDNFKVINDNNGHLAGDDVLKHIASSLVNIFSNNVIGRFGGDEFIVFSKNTSEDILVAQINQFRSDINQLTKSTITCSIGGCLANGSSISVRELINEADEAMYNVKKNGKNNFYFKTIDN